jgi:hypothetical protein
MTLEGTALLTIVYAGRLILPSLGHSWVPHAILVLFRLNLRVNVPILLGFCFLKGRALTILI